jgi:hypothetical protein
MEAVRGERRGGAREVGRASRFRHDETGDPGGLTLPGEVLHAAQRQPAGHHIQLHGGKPYETVTVW